MKKIKMLDNLCINNHKDVGTLYLIFIILLLRFCLISNIIPLAGEQLFFIYSVPFLFLFGFKINELYNNSFSNLRNGNFKYSVIDYFLIFQFNVCSSTAKQILPNYFFLLLFMSFGFNCWWLLAVYVLLMIFCVVTVTLGKLFPRSVGVFLTQFYKKYATPTVFQNYCGNPFSAIAGSAAKVMSTGSGRIAAAVGVAVLGQDAAHKSGVGQYPRYKFEEWANNGTHPSGQPFLFKDNGPSWGDRITGNCNKPD